MKRKDFIQIIKLRSAWKIDKRRGNYQLPNGSRLLGYVDNLVEEQLELDKLAVDNDGNLQFFCGGNWNEEELAFDDYEILIPFAENEIIDVDTMESRVRRLVYDIIGI